MRLFCCIFNHCFFGIFYDLQPTWTSGKVLASPALDSPGLVKALRSMMTTSKRFWHRSRRNAQTLKTNKIHEDEKWRGAQINRGKRKPIKYHETLKLKKKSWNRHDFAGFFFLFLTRKIAISSYLFPLGVHPILGIYSHQGKCSWKSKFHSKRKVSPPGLKVTIFKADLEFCVPGRGNLCCSMESKAAMETKSTLLSSVSSYSIE